MVGASKEATVSRSGTRHHSIPFAIIVCLATLVYQKDVSLQTPRRLLATKTGIGRTRPLAAIDRRPAPTSLSCMKSFPKRQVPAVVPEGASPTMYFLALLGPVLISAAVGLQMTLAAILLAKPPSRHLSMLSDWGRFLFYPEHDVVLYVAGILFALSLSVALSWVWSRRLKVRAPSASPVRWLVWLGLQAGVAIGGTAVFMVVFLRLRVMLFTGPTGYLLHGLKVPRAYLAAFAALILISLASALGGQTTRGSKAAPQRVILPDDEGRRSRSHRLSPADLVVPLAILAVVYVPQWRQMSGRFFLDDILVHWDFFAMGPALAFSHGRALGSDAYSIYGVGWPMFFGWLSSWIPLSYGRMIQIGSIYAGLYFTGVYLFLRLLVRRPILAALGTGLAMLPLFIWLHGLIIWRVPNVTPLRWAFDIWCLIALQRYLATGKRLWTVVAGAFVGLALFFTIDTGLELSAAVGFFWLCAFWLRDGQPGRWSAFLGCIGSGLGVLVVGLAIASRGTLPTSRFLTGWLEAPLEFGGGFGMLPMATWTGKGTMISFALLVFIDLSLVGYSMARLLHGKARRFEMFNGVLALYSLLVLVKFLGHSDDSIFPRLLTPAAIVLTNLAGLVFDRAGWEVIRRWGNSFKSRIARAAPYAVVLAALTAVILSVPRPLLVSPFKSYPGWLSAQFGDRTPDGVCLSVNPRDICGLPAQLSSSAQEFRTLTSRLGALGRKGYTFAVLDETGSLSYLQAGSAPFGRYAGLLTTAYTKRLVDKVVLPFKQNPPDFVLTRLQIQPGSPEFDQWLHFGLGPRPGSHYEDTWDAINAIVHQHYRVVSSVSPYQLWQLVDRPHRPLQADRHRREGLGSQPRPSSASFEEPGKSPSDSPGGR
jgi:hypothetical protein